MTNRRTLLKVLGIGGAGGVGAYYATDQELPWGDNTDGTESDGNDSDGEGSGDGRRGQYHDLWADVELPRMTTAAEMTPPSFEYEAFSVDLEGSGGPIQRIKAAPLPEGEGDRLEFTPADGTDDLETRIRAVYGVSADLSYRVHVDGTERVFEGSYIGEDAVYLVWSGRTGETRDVIAARGESREAAERAAEYELPPTDDRT
jgi:hypothetical protein